MMQNDSAVSITLPMIPDAPQHTAVGEGLAGSYVHNPVMQNSDVNFHVKQEFYKNIIHVLDVRRSCLLSIKLQSSISFFFTIHLIRTGARVWFFFLV